jgi:hypothetical protein
MTAPGEKPTALDTPSGSGTHRGLDEVCKYLGAVIVDLQRLVAQ